MEDYPDAVKHHSAAYERRESSSEKLGAPKDRAVLLFQLGSSQYLVGNEKKAAAVLSAYLAEFPDGQFAQYAGQLLATITR